MIDLPKITDQSVLGIILKFRVSMDTKRWLTLEDFYTKESYPHG